MLNYVSLKKELGVFYKGLSFTEGATLWLAVSGGIDSSFLMAVTAELFHEKQLSYLDNIKVIHINHNLRGAESNGDENFVRECATKYQLPIRCFQLQWSASEKKSQDVCRKKRESIYKLVLKKNDYLALAHHSDDLAETIFMRIMRGTGIDSLLPMERVQSYRIRPLLPYTKKMIQKCAREKEILWREDSSNQKSKYERNWLRNEIFPMLEERRPGFTAKLNALAHEAKYLSTLLAETAPKHINVNGGNILYLRKDLQHMSLRALHLHFKTNRSHTTELQKIFQKDSARFETSTFKVWVSCGLVLYQDHDHIFPKQIQNNRSLFTSVLGEWSQNEKYLELRSYERGRSGKLKELFIKKKVPAFLRFAIPIAHSSTSLIPAIPGSLLRVETIQTKLGNISYKPSALAKKIATEFEFQFG